MKNSDEEFKEEYGFDKNELFKRDTSQTIQHRNNMVMLDCLTQSLNRLDKNSVDFRQKFVGRMNKLISSIDDFNNTSIIFNKRLVWLNRVLIVLTLVLVAFGAFGIISK